ncbi:YcnI family copper-binding membrane protein [Leucobacter sp. GX24907]
MEEITQQQMSSRAKRPFWMAGAAMLGAVALAFGGAVAANAHVTINSDTAEAGAYSLLTFSVPHGCDGSATTAVSIQIPEEITSVTPTRNPLYSVETVSEILETPITDSHGNEMTERIAEVIYTTQTPLPDGQRDAFELSLKLPDDAAGTTLYFPTVQTCEQGESAWVQIAAEGQDPHELDLPSPEITIVEASANSGHGEHTAEGSEAVTQDEASSAQTPLVITALVIGTLGLLTGIVALVRGRKQA